MNPTRILSVLVAFTLLAGPAWADWNVGDGHKMHFPQLPDAERGLDVLATYPVGNPAGIPPFGKILADDWRCSSTGPVSDIHLWGSWLEDRLPVQPDTGAVDPAAVDFKLSIHKNIPAGVDDVPYSRPGEELWQIIMPPTRVVRWLDNVDEGFFDPNQNEVIGRDQTIWQYNFILDTAAVAPFRQTRGEIYWLDVQAMPALPDDPTGPIPQWGWKTADLFAYPEPYTGEHFEDDAVFGDNLNFGATPVVWKELKYPGGHPLEGRSIDLAFVITIPEPASIVLLVLGAAGLAVVARRRLVRN